MALNVAAGQWAVIYNDDTLAGIEAAEPDINTDTTTITTLDGTSFEKVTNRSASVVLTVVDTGITNLKKLLPNDWLAAATLIPGQPAGTIATTGGAGVITFGKPSCGSVTLTAPLQLVPCENPADHTVTLFDGVAEITDITLDDTVLKYEITVSSHAVQTQMAKGAVTFPA